MAYILFVIADSRQCRNDKGAVSSRPASRSAGITLVMAFYGELSDRARAGMGLNAFFAFTVVLTYKYSWQQALAAVFCSGALFFLLSMFRVREYIIDAIPKNLKLAISAGVGLFLAIIVLEEAKIVVAHPRRLSRSAISSNAGGAGLLASWLIAGPNYRKVIGGT